MKVKELFSLYKLRLYDGTILKHILLIKYKKFNDKNCNIWAEENYNELSNGLTDEEKMVLSEYCKENNPHVNACLRNNEYKKVKKMCDILRGITNKKAIGENIIAYRIINKNYFDHSDEYIENGFMSLSLVDGDINSIHNGEYKYVVLIDSRIKGFYVDFISNRSGEFELLLPDGMRIKKFKKQNNFFM